MLSMLKRLQTAVHIVTDSGDTVDDCFTWEDEHVLVSIYQTFLIITITLNCYVC